MNLSTLARPKAAPEPFSLVFPPDHARTFPFPVREHELDADGRLSVVSLCGHLQDAASRHAGELGFSVERLSQSGLTWVLSRLLVDIVDRPGKDVELTLHTWPSGVSGLFATRDFLVTGTDGEAAVRATTAWLMLDVKRRRPARLTDDLLTIAPSDSLRSVSDDFQRLAPLGADAIERRVRSGWSDLDVNRHVNHVRYVAWMLDAIPADLRGTAEVSRFELHFRAEIAEDRDLVIRSSTRKEQGASLVRQDLVDGLTGAVYAESRSRWSETPAVTPTESGVR